MKPILSFSSSSSSSSPYLAGLGSGCFQRERGSDRWKDLQLAGRRERGGPGETWGPRGTWRLLGGKSLHFNKSSHSNTTM